MIVRNGKAIVQDQIKDHQIAEWTKEEATMKQNLSKGIDAMRAYFYFFYPNKEQLAIQGLLAGLQIGDKNENYVNRATFDFLISHLAINGPMLNDEERV